MAKHAYGLLQEYCKRQDLVSSRRLLPLIIDNGFDSISLFADHFIRLFSFHGSLVEANQSFSKVAIPSRYTWSAIIAAHAKVGKCVTALQLYLQMLLLGMEGDKYAFLAALRACIIAAGLTEGRHIHEKIVRNGLEVDAVLGSTLIHMYVKCQSLEEAHDFLNKLMTRNVVSWNAMIGGYVQHDEGFLALQCFEKMQVEGIEPDKVTFSSLLKGCGIIKNIEQGRHFHEQILELGFQSDLYVGSALVDMYSKCGNFEEACEVLGKMAERDVVSWGALIAGYLQHGKFLPALECLGKMQEDDVKPNDVTISSLLKECSTTRNIGQGRCIHEHIIRCELQSDIVIGSALIDMYAKCGFLKEGQEVLDKLPCRDVVSWGAMIAGYVQHGEGHLALESFRRMQIEGIISNKITFSSALKACCIVGAIELGSHIHQEVINAGLDLDVIVGNTLVDMYAKCGRLATAHELIHKLGSQDVAAWGSLLAGYAQGGDFDLAVQCLQEMQQMGIRPNGIIFSSILSACCHAGLVDEGRKYFRSMKEDHGILPDAYHSNCMVGLLSRRGCLNEAENILQSVETEMSLEDQIVGWVALLTACRTYKNVELGRRCFDRLAQLSPRHGAGHVLMSHIYLDADMFNDAAKIEELRQCMGAWKKPAKAWIEISNKVHEFVVGDKSHPRSEEIYGILKSLSSQMKEQGYTPMVELVLQKISDQEKEDILIGHCEKLAIAFGFLAMPPGTTIHATKNLRVCIDCHNAIKVISKMKRREIVIRDAYRIHQFKDGFCSCGDYY